MGKKENKEKYNQLLEQLNYKYYEYFALFDYTHSKKHNSNIIFDIQRIVNENINELNIMVKQLKQEKILITYKEDSLSSDFLIEKYKKLIELNKLIIDDLIIKYCCENSCTKFSQLVDNNQKNTNYDYEKVLEYLAITKEDYLEKNNYCIICDLSNYNLKCGDVIIYSQKKGFNYREIKAEGHSAKMLEIVLKGNIDSLNGKEHQEALRIKKQIERHKELDNIFGLPLLEEGIRYNDNHKEKDTFIKQIKEDLKRTPETNFIEREVDDCIKYLIVNNQNIDQYTEKKLAEYECNGINKLTYNEFMNDAKIHRPYFMNWDIDNYIDLIMDNITIYVKIDPIVFFTKLKKEIPNLKHEKITAEDYNIDTLLKINGRKLVIYTDYGDCIELHNMIFYRIACLFFKSDYAIKKFVKDEKFSERILKQIDLLDKQDGIDNSITS